MTHNQLTPQLPRYLFIAIGVLCVIVGFYQLVQISERLTEKSPQVTSASRASISPHHGQEALQNVLDNHLFGQAATVNRHSSTTSLALSLSGIFYSDDPQQALAVIIKDNYQHVYAIGDTIIGTNAIVTQIGRDHILMRRAGHEESLYLPNQSPPSAPIEPTTSTEKSSLPSVSQIINDPAQLNQYIAIRAYRRGKFLVGYQIKPGPKPRLFHLLGFKKDDIVISINGYALNDTKSVMTLLHRIHRAKRGQVVVLRQGLRRTITIAFPT